VPFAIRILGIVFDPIWHIFNNAQVYKMGNNTHMDLTKYTDADDNRYTADPTGDGLLRYEDMIAEPFGELPGYNESFFL
jgi:hypothetical protein